MNYSSIPKLRFSEFTGEWENKKLGDLLEFKNGINASKEQYGSGYKFINVLDILNNEFLTHDKIIGSVDVTKDIVDRYPVNYGDILFQRSSETREDVGSACVYLDIDNTATFGGFVIRGRKIGEYNPVFLNKLLKTDSARDSITSKSGGSTRFNVGQETLSSVDLLFPSLPEQQKIASFLTVVDDKLQALKKKKSLLEQYKKGLMQKIFSQELRFKDTSTSLSASDDGKEFPKWEVRKLGEVLEIQGGFAFKSNLFNQGKTKVIRIGDINPIIKLNKFSGAISEEVPDNKYRVKKNDFLMALSGATFGKVGKIDDDGIGYINQRVALFKTKQCLEYFYQLVQTDDFKNYINSIPTASAQPNISNSDILNYESVIPHQTEQTKIANFLSAIDEKINLVSGQIEKMEVWKKGLLQKMFV